MKYVNFDIAELLLKKMLGTLSAEEEARLRKWVAASEHNRGVYEDFMSGKSWRQRQELMDGADERAMVDKVWRKIRRKERRRMRVAVWSVAASVLLLVGVGGFLWKGESGGTGERIEGAEMADRSARPAVVLELSSGRQVNLVAMDTAEVRQMELMGVMNDAGTLTYADTADGAEEVGVHTLWVPRGAEYMLALSDGTRIWLNADSRVRYPSRVVEGERQVYLEGEAYFEVARDTSRPFVVRTSTSEVRVLGTAFNVRAYPEERQRTTLVTGRVAVASPKGTVALKPGEQAVEEEGGFVIRRVNLDEQTAWLRHVFVFVNTPLGEVLGSLERWYDIEVFVVNPALRELRFTASFSRYEHLEKILKTLEMTTHIAFDLKGRTLIVRRE